MRNANANFMFSFPNLSAASCQVNFSRRLCYRIVKRRQPTAVRCALPSRPTTGSPSGAGTQELQFVQELEVSTRSGAAIYMRAWSCKSCNFWYTNINYKINL